MRANSFRSAASALMRWTGPRALTALLACATVIGGSAAALLAPSGAAGASSAVPAVNSSHASKHPSSNTPTGELSIATPAGHKPLGVVPYVHHKKAAVLTAPRLVGTTTSYPCTTSLFTMGCPGPLVYTTKGQAMVQTGGFIGKHTVYAVYWMPSTYQNKFPTLYETRIDTYLANVAHTSGKPSNVYSVAQQYYTAIGGTKHHIHYTVKYGGDLTMTTPFPASNCTVAATHTLCLMTTFTITSVGEAAQLKSYLAAHSTLPKGNGAIYLVYFPPKVETCFRYKTTTTGTFRITCSVGAYCGFHSGTTATGKNVLYGNMPFPPATGCSTAPAEQLTGTPAATVMISVTSHEQNETITDSSTQWRAATGNEIGDECAYVYGTPLGGTESAGTAWNQTIDGTHYFTQLEFSDENYKLTGTKNGCIPREELPTASFTGSLAVSKDAADAFTSTSTDPDNTVTPLAYTWTWGDGTAKGTTQSPSHTFTTAGTYTVKLTVTDGDMWSNSVTHTVKVTATTTPHELAISTPSTTAMNQSFSVNVTVENATGVKLSTDSTSTVALAISAGTLGATLTCTGATTDKKVAKTGADGFSCTINKAHTGYKLTASSAGLTSATTGTFTITTTTTPTPVPTPTPPSPPAAPSGATSHATCSVISGTCHASDGGVTVTGSTGPGALTVSEYSADPAGTPSFSSTGAYFDVATSSTSTFGSVTVKDCSLHGGTKLYWWDPSTAKWEAVSPVTGPAGTPGCLTATLSSTSTPAIGELKGTVFAIGTAPPSTPAATRTSGPTADATAAAELERAFPFTKGTCPPSRTVVLATTAEYQDALSSQYLAQSLATGTLLTPTASLSSVTEAALKQEGIAKVEVVGGPLAITTAVLKAIEALTAYECGGKTKGATTGKIAVTRIAGATQYATAAAVAEHVGPGSSLGFPGAYATTNKAGGTGRFNDTAGLSSTAPPPGALPTAILASGTEFQDAQAASVVSYRTKLPLLLTPPSALSTTALAAIQKLGVKQVILMGGTLAVADTVEAALVQKAGVFVLRVAGSDYTGTAAELARFEVAGKTTGLGWTPGHRVLLARGNGFSDGIAGAVLDSPHNTATGPATGTRPLLLTETQSVVGTSLAAFLKATGAKGIDGTAAKTITSLTVLGGPLALSTALVAEIQADLGL